MRVGATAKWAGIPIAVFAALAVAVAWLVDAESVRGRVIAGLEDASGGDVNIAGKIDLSLSLRPAVVIEGLSVTGARSGPHAWRLELERTEAQLALLPLIGGVLHFHRLILVEPNLLVTSGAGSAGDAPDASGIASRTPSRIPIVERLEIHRGVVVHRDPGRARETGFAIERATLGAPSVSTPHEIELEGAWNGTPFSVTGNVDSLGKLVRGSPIAVELRAELPGVHATVKGSVARAAEAAGVELRFAAAGEIPSALPVTAGLETSEASPFDLGGVLRGSVRDLQIDDLHMRWGESDLTGHLRIDREGTKPRVSGALASKRMDGTEVLAVARGALAPEASHVEASGGGPTREAPDRVFPAHPLPLPGMHAIDLDLDLRIATLRTPRFSATSIALGLVLDDGTLTVLPFSAEAAGSPVEGSLRWHADAPASSSSLVAELRAPELDLGELFARSGASDMFQGTAALDASLQGSGDSIASLFAGLDGSLTLLANEARLKTRAFDTVAGGATAILGTLFSGQREWTLLNCAASIVDIRDGVATSRVTLVDSAYSTVIVTGRVDLASETLDLVIEPRAKSATLNLAVPVRVKGTLADPRFEPERGATVRKVGGLLGLALFPPAAIAALGELGSGDNRCLEIAGRRELSEAVSDQTADSARPRVPDAAVEKVVEGAAKVVDELGGRLERLFGSGE